MGRGQKTATDNNTKVAIGTADTSRKADASNEFNLIGEVAQRARDLGDKSKSIWFDPARAADVRVAASTVADASDKAMEGQIENYSARTGVNTANIPATIAEGRRESQRGLNSTLVADKLQSYENFDQDQKYGLGILGELPKIYAQNYASDTGLYESALGAQAGVDRQRVQPQTPWWQIALGAGTNLATAFIPKPGQQQPAPAANSNFV